MVKKIFIKTFGCQMNEYDTNRIYDTVKNIGYVKTNDHLNADCYLLNTCHIRDKSKEKVFDEIGRVRKNYKNKKKPIMIVAGCVAQAESGEMIKREPYIDIIIGPQSYHKINKIIENFNFNKKEELTEFDTEDKFNYLDKIKNHDSRVSSFLTIQEGCDKFCNFCVVPYTRGPEYSRPFKRIIEEAESLVKNGTKEITLLGQNVNAYFFKDKNKSYKLSDLILELDKINDLIRIRYTTSHPKDMTEDLIECYSSSNKLMPFIHLPIQSGSDKILKLMNRNHKVEKYLEIYKLIKQKNQNVEFSSDFIVGYPGELECDFNDTMNLVKEIKFINSYSFIFSPRPGTPASKLELVDKEIAKERLVNLQKALEDHQIKKNTSLVNSSVEVLVENKLKNQENYFGRNVFLNSVLFEGEDKYIGKIVNVKIEKTNRNTLFGRIDKNKSMRAA
ncbi:tRNA (N6-isopentenyl adenosine(37)-C2)-methylthiotransferase MiaB [Candidatus Pelagibacter sp.]|nr:tRNA (N6-isopentenyl adenosine(37)-C2)-methylthiotransferase MiaB [Candidatus Pelagibacter sp.]